MRMAGYFSLAIHGQNTLDEGMPESRSILHIDMDAFYASVEQLDHPHLLGKPVIVGGSLDARGVVSAASYEARQFGVHSAMPLRRAVRLCPQAVLQPVRMERYVRISRRIQRIFRAYTPLVEPLSLDEAFLDVTGSRRLFGPPETIGRTIQQRIRDETGLQASVGVAPNKFLAKLASDLKKPNGFVVVTRAGCQALLDPLPVGRIWGIGKVAQQKLGSHGFRLIRDLRQAPLSSLQRVLGDQALALQNLACGRDDRPVQPEHAARSLSCERTFATDIENPQALRRILLEETEHVMRRLRKQQLAARTVTLKLRDGSFRTLTRSRTLAQPTQRTEEIWQAAQALFGLWQRRSFVALRLLGIGVTGLCPVCEVQPSLFTHHRDQGQARIDRVMDRVQQRYGSRALHRVVD